MTRGAWHVPANFDVAPRGWWLDPMLRAEKQAQVRALHREGHSNLEVARRSGVSDRSVNRILGRARAASSSA